jgi:hypothetical protein
VSAGSVESVEKGGQRCRGLIERAGESLPAVATREVVDRATCCEQWHQVAAQSAEAVVSFLCGGAYGYTRTP